MFLKITSTSTINIPLQWGVTHFVGLDFRYKIVQIGSELKLGTPKFQNWGERVPDNYDYNAQLGCSDFRATNLRFFIGVKF